jgi:hypothetical protein
MTWSKDLGSFRDPSGFVFASDGVVYRQVNAGFGALYRRLKTSGLYDDLVRDRLLVGHDEVALHLPGAPPADTILRPEQVPFISYPYEWCFSQLQAAALLTLDIQRRALAKGMTLRDASAYNVQFVGTRPVFIDTLSFGEYAEGKPWAAYRQFCQHFLAPLALRAHTHGSLGDLARIHIDGIPLELASRLLPYRSRLSPGLLLHLHLHGRSATRAATGEPVASRSTGAGMGRTAMLGLLDSLERTVRRLSWKAPATLWSTYAARSNYTAAAQEDKRRIVSEMIETVAARTRLRTIWDVGANDGAYSRIAAATGASVVAFDSDHAVVERHFRAARESTGCVLPLVQDVANPSPATGWNSSERKALLERGPADLALALALVHHLALGANVPLESVAAVFSRMCRYLVIEFVPKEDSQVQEMLALREDVFEHYTQAGFERAAGPHFTILRSERIADTVRTVYLLERR